jgi:hypothetical protein
MMTLARIAAWSIVAFGALLFLAQLVAHEVGFWVGRRYALRSKSPGEGVGVLVGSVLALLAFVLALTLSFASDRFNERRSATIAGANAIGTAWLRAKAIGQPRGDQIAHLLEQYTTLRISFVRAPFDPAVLDGINDRTEALQRAIWEQLSAIVQTQPNPVSASLMASLNEVFDATAAERMAFEIRMPPQIFWLLLGLSLLGMAVLGFQLGVRGPRIPVLAALLSLTWTLVIVDILDLAAARIGNLRTSTAAYDYTLEGFGAGKVMPPQLQ